VGEATVPTGAACACDEARALLLPPGITRVVVILVHPTQYDDDGFPYRFLRGVMPSNSLAVMNGITRRCLENLLPPGIESEVHMLVDSVQEHAKRLDALIHRFPERGTRVVFGCVGVQTAQFPRACDLLDRWQKAGAACVIGGFHVSGSISTLLDGIVDARRPGIPCPGRMPPEIQALMDRGIVVFHGEAEDVWQTALQEILEGRARPMYRGGQPDLSHAPLPVYDEGHFKDSYVTTTGTLDTGRGCPFVCSFCTIINVQGRKSRHRDPRGVVEWIRGLCERDGGVSLFFTDDNFARNPKWADLLDGLIDLRSRGHDVDIMVEADLACGKIPDFLPKIAAAGCSQIFMGVESVNPKNLESAHKPQNHVQEYAALWRQCHDLGMLVHAAYIIGFPDDTPKSVAEDVQKLADLGADQVSFFMLTPIPGSEDHVRAAMEGFQIEDLNECDSFHAIIDHPKMTRAEWFEAYLQAWRQFYSVPNMIRAIERHPGRGNRMTLLRNYLWYRSSFVVERTHPMIAGFYRFRPYNDRRPSARPLSYPRYLAQEAWRHLRYAGHFVSEFYRFQQVVFETCPDESPSRMWLNHFWTRYARNRWNLLVNPLKYHWHFRMVPHALAEVVYSVRFAAMLPRLIKVTTR